MKAKKFSRILFSVLWLLSAVLLVVAGIGVMTDYGSVMEGIASWIGIVMVVSGLLELAACAVFHGTILSGHAFLTRAIATAAVGILLLCQSFLAGGIIQIIFSVMLIVDAVSMFSAASSFSALKNFRFKGKHALWVLAVLELILGICGFIKPEVLHMALGILIGISLIYEGITLVYTWFVSWKWKKALEGA